MSERVALAVITEAGGGGPAGGGVGKGARAGLCPAASVLSPCFSLSAHSAMRPRM
jgi:hypothetical protein